MPLELFVSVNSCDVEYVCLFVKFSVLCETLLTILCTLILFCNYTLVK